MLSIIWVSRNDDHGGNLIPRTQASLNSLAEYRDTFGLDVEVVFIEWNPLPNVPKLHELLTWDIPVRWYEVPLEIHKKIPNWKELSLKVHIGVNLGVRQAHGEWVLTTTPDCIFSAGLAKAMAAEPYQENCFYRACRFDAHADLFSNLSAVEQIAYMEAHMIKRNIWGGRGIYTKSSGDFILISRAQWHSLKGYVEWPFCPIWMDGYMLYALQATGMKQIVFPDPIYHMEHTDRGLHRYKHVVHMNWHTYKRLCARMSETHHVPEINHEGWGLANLEKRQVAEDRWILCGAYEHPKLRHWEDDLFAKG